MNILHRNILVPVAGSNLAQAAESVLFKEWLATIDESIILHSIEIQSVDIVVRKGKEHVLFLKLKVTATDENNNSLPGIVLLRGKTVALWVVIECDATKYLLLVQQRRVPIGGKILLELPAGMEDGEGNVTGVALKELEEETGIVVPREHLVNMNQLLFGKLDKGMYVSAGIVDEEIFFYYLNLQMNPCEIEALLSKNRGCEDEREHITLYLAIMSNISNMTQDAKVYIAHSIYTTLQHQHLI